MGSIENKDMLMEQAIPQKRENYIGVLDTLRGFLAF